MVFPNNKLELVEEIVDFLNTKFNKEGQYSRSWFENKLRVHSYNDKSAYIYNSDYLLVCVEDELFLATEDDGNFYFHPDSGFIDTANFQLCFALSLSELLQKIDTYTRTYGIAYHYIGNSSYDLEIPTFCGSICGYALGIDRDQKYMEEWRKQKEKIYEKKSL